MGTWLSTRTERGDVFSWLLDDCKVTVVMLLLLGGCPCSDPSLKWGASREWTALGCSCGPPELVDALDLHTCVAEMGVATHFSDGWVARCKAPPSLKGRAPYSLAQAACGMRMGLWRYRRAILGLNKACGRCDKDPQPKRAPAKRQVRQDRCPRRKLPSSRPEACDGATIFPFRLPFPFPPSFSNGSFPVWLHYGCPDYETGRAEAIITVAYINFNGPMTAIQARIFINDQINSSLVNAFRPQARMRSLARRKFGGEEG